MLRLLTSFYRHYIQRLDVSGWLAMLGVAVGCANIIALIGVTESGRHQAMSILTDAGARALFVYPFADDDESMFQRANVAAFLPASYLQAAQGVPEVEYEAGILMLPGHVGYGAERLFTTIEGASPAYVQVRGHKVVKGHFITEQDEASRARVCCLGADVAQELFPDADPLGEQLVLKGERFLIQGVMIEKGMVGFESLDARVFIPLSTAQEIFELPGLHTLMARAVRGVSINHARDALEAALRQASGLLPGQPADFTVNTVEELTGVLRSSLTVFNVLLVGVSSVALLVAGIGIMNVMLMQIIERTREIGVRRAVGARRRDIWLQFLTEALLQAVLGALAGVVLGMSGALIFCALVKWHPYITIGTVLLGAGFSLGIGLVFGLYPALVAAQLRPIDALRYE